MLIILQLFLYKKSNGTKTSLSFAKSDSYTDLESNTREKVLGKQKELEKLLWKADQEDIGLYFIECYLYNSRTSRK